MNISKYCLLLVVTATLFRIPAATAAKLELPEGHTYPNGITHDKLGNIYVGFVTDGTIYKRGRNDKTWTVFFEGSDEVFAATALRYDFANDLLWGASPDFLGFQNADGETIFRPARIFALDGKTGKLMNVVPVPKGSFGNDIALDDQGNLYLSDSFKPQIWMLPSGTATLEPFMQSDLFGSEMTIGLSGIARTVSGSFFLAKFLDGELLRVQNERVEKIRIDRPLPNPDGIFALSENSFIVVLGDVPSGNGEVIKVEIEESEVGPIGKVTQIAEGLVSPVNLTLVEGRELYVTEASIRHLLAPDQKLDKPDTFFVHRFQDF